MKIVHIADFYQPELGYQETNLAKAHASLGHEVTVIACDRYQLFPGYDKYKHILGRRIKGEGITTEGRITIHRLKTIMELETIPIFIGINKILVKIKPDIVCVHGMLKPLAIQATFSKEKIGYKLIYDNHDAEFNTSLEKSWKTKLYYNFFIKHILAPIVKKHADKYIAIGEPEKQFIHNRFGVSKDSIDVVRPGVDVKVFKPSKKKRKYIRDKAGISPDDRVCIFTGKIEKRKNLDLAIEALSIAIERRESVRLFIIGQGSKEYINKLKSQASSHGVSQYIHWIDMVPNNELPQYYAAADISVWPGDVSIGRFEALASGLPVVVGDKTPTKELLKAGVAITFNPGNAKSMAEAIREACLHINKNNLSKKARNYAVRNLSSTALAKSFIEM